jgi:hypothetical protein
MGRASGCVGEIYRPKWVYGECGDASGVAATRSQMASIGKAEGSTDPSFERCADIYYAEVTEPIIPTHFVAHSINDAWKSARQSWVKVTFQRLLLAKKSRRALADKRYNLKHFVTARSD